MQLCVAIGEYNKALLPAQLEQKPNKKGIQKENKITFKIQDKDFCGCNVVNLPLGLIRLCKLALILAGKRTD